MLKYKNRLKNPKAINALYRKGFIFKGKYFICKFFLRDDQRKNFAFQVSKKIAKHAVKRNRISRRLKEALRLQIDDALDVYALFMGSDRVLNADFQDLINEIKRLFIFMKNKTINK